MFNEGDKAMIVTIPQWGGDRSFVTVVIGKVHKSGRLTLLNYRDQWRKTKGFGDEPDYFSRCSGRGYERLVPLSDDLAKEIRAEKEASKNRLNVNKIGEMLSRIRDRDEGAHLWSIIPDELKAKLNAQPK